MFLDLLSFLFELFLSRDMRGSLKNVLMPCFVKIRKATLSAEIL